MGTHRRDFLLTGALAGAGLATGAAGRAAAQNGGGKAELKLSSQEGRIPGGSLKERVQRMAEWGFVGIEFGGGGLAGRVDEIKTALEGTAVKVSAICGGYASCLLADNEADRRQAVDTIKEILTAAGQISSTGLIVVPAFNGQTSMDNRKGREVLLQQLPEIGDHARQVGSRILFEPLNRGECFFLRQLADAAAICRDANNAGICMMGDFYHMGIEETSDLGAFISAGQYLHHVHLASRRRVLPGQDDRSFVDGFRGLKYIGFQDYCSLECGCDGDPMTEIPKAVRFLNDQWAQATPPEAA